MSTMSTTTLSQLMLQGKVARIVDVTNTQTKDTQSFCFDNMRYAEGAISSHMFPEHMTTNIRKPTTEDKQDVQFFTEQAFKSAFKEFEVTLSGLVQQPSVFHESTGAIDHMLTPKMKPQTAIAQLFLTHQITDTGMQDKLKPGLEALHKLATENDTTAVRSWIAENATGSGTPDTSGLMAMVEHAETQKNEKALALIMGYARYEKCKDDITAIVDSASTEQSLSKAETQKLLRIMDDILMQQYSFEADVSGSALVTLSTASAASLKGDPVFEMSSFINGKMESGHSAKQLVDHLGVKSPNENINSLQRLWDKHDTPKSTLTDILDTKYVNNSTQNNMFRSYIDHTLFEGGSGSVRERLSGPDKDNWALGMNRLLAKLDSDSSVARMATEKTVGEIHDDELSKNDTQFQAWLNRLLKPIEFAYGDLSSLSASQKEEIQQTLEAQHDLFGSMADTVPVVLKAIEAIEKGIDLRE